jgi:hypothetical protein
LGALGHRRLNSNARPGDAYCLGAEIESDQHAPCRQDGLGLGEGTDESGHVRP